MPEDIKVFQIHGGAYLLLLTAVSFARKTQIQTHRILLFAICICSFTFDLSILAACDPHMPRGTGSLRAKKLLQNIEMCFKDIGAMLIHMAMCLFWPISLLDKFLGRSYKIF